MASKYTTHSDQQTTQQSFDNEHYDIFLNNVPEPDEMDKEVNRINEVTNNLKKEFSPNENENIGFLEAEEDSIYGDFNPETGAFDSRYLYGSDKDRYLNAYNNMIDSIEEAQEALSSASGNYKYLQNEDLSDGWIADTPKESADILRTRVKDNYKEYQQKQKEAITNINNFYNIVDDINSNGQGSNYSNLKKIDYYH